jgi:uncharacterized protein (DUF1015 family)
MLHPFKAVRPTRDKAYLVATRSYISYEAYELEDKLENNPYTFLHVINPLALANEPIENRFKGVRDRFKAFEAEGIFQQEELSTYYVYSQETPTTKYIGVIGLLEANSLLEGRTLPHEKTLEQREKLFELYLNITGFQAEPVLVFGQTDSQYREILDRVQLERPEYEFSSTDRHLHKLWVVPTEFVRELEKSFKQSGVNYVADGHHRLSSSVRVAAANPENQKAQGVLCMFMDEDQLQIQAFERWFKLDDRTFSIEDLRSIYEIEPLPQFNNSKLEFDFEVYFGGTWFGLKHKNPALDEVLSPQLLLDTILKPLLGVVDERNDARLTYVRQTDQDQSMDMARLGYSIGFRMPPISVKLLKQIAQDQGSMPPKSTYIEPKLRSGLLLHVFK